jgi:hypothetical protein
VSKSKRPIESRILLADGFEQAFMGIGRQFNTMFSVYDYDECIEILMSRDDMTEEEAEEHMSFNVTGAYVGEHTPVFLSRCTILEAREAFEDEDA